MMEVMDMVVFVIHPLLEFVLMFTTLNIDLC
jgi:hypothetical protein